jgi:hypothetical protein
VVYRPGLLHAAAGEKLGAHAKAQSRQERRQGLFLLKILAPLRLGVFALRLGVFA